MKTKFKNATIITVNEKFDILKNADLVVIDHIIDYVGEALQDEDVKYDRIIDCNGNILMPGFVNSHSHAAMTLFRGMADNVVFEDWWLENMLPMEEKLTPQDIEKGVTIAGKEMLQNGVTTFFDCYFMQESAMHACEKLGIRYGAGFGAVSGKEELTLEKLEKEYEIYKNMPRVVPFLYAHSTYSCDEAQYGTLLKMAKKHNLPFSTHASETLQEVGECHNKNGVTPIGLLESYGMFDVPCVIAHAVHADKDDIALMEKYCNVSVSHNPSSNLKLGSGVAPVHSFLKHNILVSLGTDGAASNNSLDILKEMYLSGVLQFGILNNPKAVSARQMIEMATVNGAKAFAVNNLGRLKVGYLADIILLDAHMPNMQPENNVVGNVAFSASNKNVLLTMVDGIVRYEK